jgi:hypothetical protein
MAGGDRDIEELLRKLRLSEVEKEGVVLAEKERGVCQR